MIRRVLLSLLLLLTFAIVFLGWLINSESGLGWLYQQARSEIPQLESISGISGRLVGPITIEKIDFENEGQRIIAQQIRLDWDPWQLFQAEIEISDFQVASLDISLAEDAASNDDKSAAQTLMPINLPLAVRIGNAEINAIGLHRGSDNYQIDQISIQIEADSDAVQIARLELLSEQLDVKISGELSPQANYRHDLNISWRATLPNGKNVQSQGDISGTIRHTTITQKLQQAVQSNLTLELTDLLDKLTWRSEIEVSAIDPSLLDPKILMLKNLKVKAAGDLVSAQLSGQLLAENPELGDFSANFDLHSLDAERRFDGVRIDSLEINSLPGKISAKGQFDWAPTLQWRAEVKGRQLNPEKFLADWPGQLAIQLNTSGSYTDAGLVASASISDLQGALRGYPISGQSELGWADGRVDISRLDLHSGDTRLKAEGSAGERLDLRWSIDSNNLSEIYPQATGQLSAQGKVGGPASTPSVEASFSGSQLQLPGYQINHSKGQLVFDLARPDRLELSLVANELMLQGNTLQSVEIFANPKQIEAKITDTENNATIKLEGSFEVDRWHGDLVRADIQTRDYQNWQLASPAGLKISSETVTTGNICLQNDQDSKVCNQLEGSDGLWQLVSVIRKLPIGLFNQWIPAEVTIAGEVNADARLEYRTTNSLLGKVDLELLPGQASYAINPGQSESIQYQSGSLQLDLNDAGIDINAAMEMQNGDSLESEIKLKAASLLTLDTSRQTFTATAKARIADLGIVNRLVKEIDQLEGRVELNLQAKGTLRDPKLKGSMVVREAKLHLPESDLRLDDIAFSAESEDYENVSYRGALTLLGGQISISGSTALDAEAGWPSRLELEGHSFDLASVLQPLLPDDTTIEGIANANAVLNYSAGNDLTGEITLRAPSGTLNYPLLEGEIEHWVYRDSVVHLFIEAQGIRGDAQLSIGDGNVIEANLSLPGAKLLSLDKENQPLNVDANLNFQELAIIEALVPEIDRLRGEITLGLTINGTLAKPELLVRADILNASVNIPRLGLKIYKIELHGTTDNLKDFKYGLIASSGDGSLAIDGVTQLDAAAGWPTQITIKGDNFEASRIPEATLTVSPDLTIKVQHRTIDVRGQVVVPYAKIQPKDITTAAQVSGDAVIIDSSVKPQPKWHITSHVRLILGDRVSFYGFGFEGQLAGNLLIEEENGQLTRGTGEIKIPEGRYRAYGQRLDIENGRLLFTGGPITNPGLDIRAIRKTGSIVSGIQVGGRLNQPKLELFSNPAMGQTDMLSYLLFGRPMESSSGADGAVMAQAALALQLSGGDQLARSLGDRFGFDEMRVESNDTGEQASLVVGRYLSPQLYVSYGVGLVGAFNTFNLRYSITERWQLKAESGDEQGADLLYTFER